MTFSHDPLHEPPQDLREFLDGHGFLEVETPILQPIYGGAAAKPFITHHNELDQDMYLRVSFELYLKRLLVGNLERVYEIGRDFRNEGVSYKHNPEFTQLEFYWAYADYLQVMELTEQMVSYTCQQVNGSMKTLYQGHELDFTPPWRRLEMRQGLKETSGIDIEDHKDAQSLYQALVKQGKNPDPAATRGKLIDFMLSEFLEPVLIQPTFLYDYPRDISPLAKSKPGAPLMVERFEGYVAVAEPRSSSAPERRGRRAVPAALGRGGGPRRHGGDRRAAAASAEARVGEGAGARRPRPAGRPLASWTLRGLNNVSAVQRWIPGC